MSAWLSDATLTFVYDIQSLRYLNFVQIVLPSARPPPCQPDNPGSIRFNATILHFKSRRKINTVDVSKLAALAKSSLNGF